MSWSKASERDWEHSYCVDCGVRFRRLKPPKPYTTSFLLQHLHEPEGFSLKQYYVYILSNPNGMLYTGVTNNLIRRLAEHRGKLGSGYTQKFGISRLIYFEEAQRIEDAIAREKEIKAWRREKKLALVKQLNPKFEDLSEGWFD